jgi:polyisoprenoid-binding protein YceI
LFKALLVSVANLFVWGALAGCALLPSPTPTPVPPTAVPQLSGKIGAAAEALLAGKSVTFRVVPEQSEASYAVREHIFRLPSPQTTIGVSKALDGEFQLALKDGKPVFEKSTLKVDLRKLTSDQSRRDQYIRENNLESNTFPFAEFAATSVDGFPTDAAEGKEMRFQVTGNMKIHDATKPLTFDVRATLAGDTLTGTGTTFLLMKDFGFDAPDIIGLLQVTDGVTVTVKGTAKLVP